MYPKRYELLDKNNIVLGIGVRWMKYQRIKWSLPMLEASRWFAGGKRVRLLTPLAGDIAPAICACGISSEKCSGGLSCFYLRCP